MFDFSFLVPVRLETEPTGPGGPKSGLKSEN